MRTCGFCGDRYEETHECWVLAKNDTQEHLAAPPVTEWAASRAPLADAEWHALRDAPPSEAELDANLVHPLAFHR
jgi:hypothetical protein